MNRIWKSFSSVYWSFVWLCGSKSAIFIVIFEERVPSRTKLVLVFVLMRPTTENTLFASSLKVERTRTSFETTAGLWNWFIPVICARGTKNTMTIFVWQISIGWSTDKIVIKCLNQQWCAVCTGINNLQELVSTVFLLYKNDHTLYFWVTSWSQKLSISSGCYSGGICIV